VAGRLSGGADGVIATWQDERGGPPDIYAQRVTQDGTLDDSTWPLDGVAVCAAAGTQTPTPSSPL